MGQEVLKQALASGKTFAEIKGSFISQSAKRLPNSAKKDPASFAIAEKGGNSDSNLEPLSAGMQPDSKRPVSLQ